jgi:hypothetical protein
MMAEILLDRGSRGYLSKDSAKEDWNADLADWIVLR